MLLDDVLNDFYGSLFGEVSPKTIRWYKFALSSLTKHLGNPPLEEIDTSELRRWRRLAFGDLSPFTQHGLIRAVKRFFKWAVTEGVIEQNPADRLKPPRLPDRDPQAVSATDFEAMLKAAGNYRDIAIILFLADTGCRVGGLCHLQTQDLWLDEGRAKVKEKGERKRWVYFGNTTYTALVEYLAERPTGKYDNVFLGQRGPLTESGVYQLLARIANRAGVDKNFNPHAFRHAAARNWLKGGGNLNIVSRLLGHSSVTVTSDYYALWAEDELKQWHNRVSPNMPNSEVDDVSITQFLRGKAKANS